MIGLMFALICQAVAGPPQPPANPAATTPPPAVQAPVAQEAPSEQDARLRAMRERQKLVCRNEVVIGSRMPIRRCTSKAEDDAAHSDSHAWIDRAQSQMPTRIDQ